MREAETRPVHLSDRRQVGKHEAGHSGSSPITLDGLQRCQGAYNRQRKKGKWMPTEVTSREIQESAGFNGEEAMGLNITIPGEKGGRC